MKGEGFMKPKSIITFILSTFFIISFPLFLHQAEAANNSLRMDPEVAKDLGDLEIIRQIDYGSYIWLEVSDETYAQIEANGIPFQPLEDPSTLTIQEYQINTEEQVLSIQSLSPEEPTTTEEARGFHLIQLVGPTRDGWISQLETLGLEILQYYSPQAYLVRATNSQIDTAMSYDFLRWSGPYLPKYKYGEDLYSLSGTIEYVEAKIYAREGLDGTIDAIVALGGTLEEMAKPHETDKVVIAAFTLDSNALEDIAALDNVLWMNHRPPVDSLEDEQSSQIIAGNFPAISTDAVNPGYQTWLTNNNIDGTGVTLGMIDSGYDDGSGGNPHPDVTGRLTPVGNPVDTNGHGTHVGGIMISDGSNAPTDTRGHNIGLGVAPNAGLVVRFFSGGDAARTQDIVTNGAIAANNSYALHDASIGYTARDATWDGLVRDADTSTAAAEPLIIVFSAGNCGNSPTSPTGTCKGNNGTTKEAKNIIAVANSLNQRSGTGTPNTSNIDSLASGSSRGPAQDGRVYPHVSAPGTNIVSTFSQQTPTQSCLTLATGAGAPANNPTYSMCTGTSMAAPHVTGSIGLIAEWWRGFNAGADPSPAMAKSLLVNGATDMGTADIPNGNEGWGRINLSNVINTGIATFYLDQSLVFDSSGESFSRTFIPDNPALPVKVTLSWTDQPAAGGANPTLINNLDLTVVEGAVTYLGNDFANGLSTTGGSADNIDNLENVFLGSPTGEGFTVTVGATNIAGDGVPGGDGTDQDFALVVQNAIEVATINVIKKVDSEPDNVFDNDPSGWTFDVIGDGLGGQTTDSTGMVTFLVPAGNYSLMETNGPGGFWLTNASCIDNNGGASIGTGAIDAEFPAPGGVGVTGLNLVSQQNITCTFMNKWDQALIKVIKTVDSDPNNTFDGDPSGWTFDVIDDDAPVQVTDATGILEFPVRAGTYDVSESLPPAGDNGLWLVDAVCLDDADGTTEFGTGVTDQVFGPAPNDAPVKVTGLSLLAGIRVTCRFENQRMAGFITGGGHIKSENDIDQVKSKKNKKRGKKKGLSKKKKRGKKKGLSKKKKRRLSQSKGNNGNFITFGGNVSVALDGKLHGQWQTNFHTTSNGNVNGRHFHSTHVDQVVFRSGPGEPADPPEAIFNGVVFDLTGRLNGRDGQICNLRVDATDHGEPGHGKNSGADSDSIRFTLDCPDDAFDYDSFSSNDFAEEESDGLHNLTGGNLQIHPPRED
jgi:hypothetical protein